MFFLTGAILPTYYIHPLLPLAAAVSASTSDRPLASKEGEKARGKSNMTALYEVKKVSSIVISLPVPVYLVYLLLYKYLQAPLLQLVFQAVQIVLELLLELHRVDQPVACLVPARFEAIESSQSIE